MGSAAQRRAPPVTSTPSQAGPCGFCGSGVISVAPLVASGVKTLKSSHIVRRSQHTTVSSKGGRSSGQQQAVPLVRDVHGLRRVFTLKEDMRKWKAGHFKNQSSTIGSEIIKGICSFLNVFTGNMLGYAKNKLARFQNICFDLIHWDAVLTVSQSDVTKGTNTSPGLIATPRPGSVRTKH